MKGTGDSTPQGEAQGKELPPQLGTLRFPMNTFCFVSLVLVSLSVRGSLD